ncbi:MAG TPA: ABC transporter permease [Gemmatimonadaceae bacterium]|nr:ABC transporter permease [Gemmatimonadaceae bacterium]
MDTFLRDLRYALRRLTQSPGFTVIVLLTLALGIGANSAIFTVVNTVLLRPLPYREPEKLVQINHFYRSASLNNLEASVSAVGFRDYRDNIRSFSSMGAESGWGANLTGVGTPQRIAGSRVTGDWFRTLGAQAQLGRTLQAGDEVAGNHIAVISHGLWVRVFGSDPGIVGRDVQLNGEAYRVVGVMPATFHSFFSRNAELWAPLAFSPAQLDPRGYTNEFLTVTGRLAPGITLEQAQSEMTTFADRLKEQYPNNLGKIWTLKVTSLEERATGQIRPALLVLLGAVGFVLLIACANVANLLLVRAAGRTKEIAIRSALGAERGVLVRQLLTESVVLAVTGGVVGLGLSWWAVRALLALNPELPRASEVGIDSNVLLFTVAVTLFTGLLFGLAPAIHAARTDLQRTLREAGRGTHDASAQLVRRVLVVAEVAIALTLLAGAGLLIRSVMRLQSVNPGFDSHGVLAFTVSLPPVKYRTDTAQRLFYDEALMRIRAVPGVEAAGLTTNVPFGGNWSTSSFDLEGYTPAPNQPGPWGDARIVSADYFRALRIPVVEGRVFDATDNAGTQKVAVVDDQFVQRLSPDRDVIGRRIAYDNVPGDTVPDWITIIGVVHHTMHEGLDADPRLQVYRPYQQRPIPFMGFTVRTTGDPLKAVPSVRAALNQVDADIPMSGITTLDALVDASLGQRKLSTLLLGAFSAIALLIAAIGIYGIMAQSVTQRTRELGIRMALGAARGRVLGLVMSQGLALALIGIAMGLVSAFALTRLLANQLFEVKTTDPTTFVVVAALLASVALLATLIPALRATRVDPVQALREE